jgi:hypothetical protein
MQPRHCRSCTSALTSVVKPRIELVPRASSRGTSLGDEAVELAASAGLVLDDWQEYVLRRSLGMKGKRWAAFEVGVTMPRQNGKGALLMARELAGLFLLDEELIIHSAHQFDTSLEHFRRLEWLILETPELEAKVKRVSRSHGDEAIETVLGTRIRFRTRTRSGGRGFSCDLLVLDEAMDVSEHAHAALLPTLSARERPQIWYAGSAVDQLVHDNGIVFARVRERALRGDDDLAYFEWSIEGADPDLVSDEVAGDEAGWQQANPALGIRIPVKHVEAERRALDARAFATERLGVGSWPPTTSRSTVIDLERWMALADPESAIEGAVVFAFDVKPDRSAGAIAVAGKRADGNDHVEVVERQRGTSWLVPRLLQLREAHQPRAIVCDSVGPAASLVQALQAEGVAVTQATAREVGNACAQLFDGVANATLRHLGQPQLLSALRGAQKRPLGDSWAWSRRDSGVDISVLVAATLALWASAAAPPEVEPFVMFL